MSSVTLFELYSGAKTARHREDISKITRWIDSVFFDDDIAEAAALIYRDLKGRNEIVEFRDIFIGATAKCYDLWVVTLNLQDFRRISGLKLLEE